jgi:tetratricopeptide (TPR) repeat protein
MAAASRDIDIRIFRSDQPDGACRVSISGADDRRADGVFRSPFLKAEVERALSWMDLATPWASAAAAEVRDFGRRLSEALFQGAVAGVYVASQDANTPPRVRLTVDDPVAARIPWELLVDSATGEALALRGRFVRGIATEGGARRLVVDPPLRVLVVDSAPRGLPRLDGQLEASDISRALAGVVAQGRVEVETLEHATLSGTLNALREAAAANPPRSFHVLHWIGHGYVDPVTGANQLLFEDDEGGVDRVDGARLASVLVGSEIRLVLLNACHSAAPATEGLVATPAAETTRGIAEVLLTMGIPAVVGMRVAVLDDTARRFAREFYAALADGRGVDEAVLDARILVTGRASGVSAEVGVPVAYLRSGSGQLLSGVVPLAWWQAPLVRFRRLTPLARVAVFVALVVATLAVERSVDAVLGFFERPAQMTADLNVVVTEFDGLDASGRPVASEAARGLAEDLARVLDVDLRNELERQQQRRRTVAVRPPADAGRLSGTTPAERAAAAATLAGEVGAHVVVYGSLDATRTELQPEIYVSEGLLADAEELLGSMRLGPPIRATAAIDEEIGEQAEMREQLVTRARALAALVLGMSELRGARYDAADEYLETAATRWGDAPGKEVVYLFRGGAAAVSHRLDDAERWFNEALALNPSYGRARMGLAEVAFQRAKGSCEWEDPSVDAEGLMHALDEYRAAGTATDDGGAVSAVARARLGMARIYACMGQAGIGGDSWAAAEREATAVISAYEAGDELLRELAAEAHAVRAITRLPFEGDPEREAALQRAEQDLRAAIDLARYVGRRAAYRAELARVLALQGRNEDARNEYDNAINEEPDADDRDRYRQLRDALPAEGTGHRRLAIRSASTLSSPQSPAVGGLV